MDLELMVRGVRDTLGRGLRTLTGGPYGEAAVSQLLPPYAQLCAAGKVFAADTSAGTAAIPVVSHPTTSPQWAIYNANQDGGPSLLLLHVSAIMTEGTAGLGCCLAIGSGIGPQAVVTANATNCVVSCLDGSTKTPQAYITSNPTLVGGAPAWVNIEAYDQIASNGVGEGICAWVHGLLIAPPKGLLCAEVVSETGAASKYDLSFVFAEVQL